MRIVLLMSKQSKKIADQQCDGHIFPNGDRLTLFHVIGLTAGIAAGIIAGMWCFERTESVLLGTALGVVVAFVVFVIAFTVIVYLVFGIIILCFKLGDLFRGSHSEYFDDD